MVICFDKKINYYEEKNGIGKMKKNPCNVKTVYFAL